MCSVFTARTVRSYISMLNTQKAMRAEIFQDTRKEGKTAVTMTKRKNPKATDRRENLRAPAPLKRVFLMAKSIGHFFPKLLSSNLIQNLVESLDTQRQFTVFKLIMNLWS